ncbi:MAG: hypothetical protein JXR83_00010, partial [Deltaproteobacteria bacterium]|nr:hypothetical protein [Deltaproteobacteria bacterium]
LAAQRDYLVEDGEIERAAALAGELSDLIAGDAVISAAGLSAHRVAAELAARAGLDLQAARLYERLIEAAADDESTAPELARFCSALADVYERLGRFEDVARTLARAVLVCRDETAATALFRRTALVEENRLARPERAIQAWERVLRANPDDDDAARSLSKLYEFVGDVPALVELHRQRAQRATSGAQRAAFLIAAGDAVAEVDSRQAVALFHAAIDAAPESPAAIERLTRLSRKSGSLVSLVRGYMHAARLREGEAGAQLYEEAGAILAGLLDRPRLAVPVLLRSIERQPARTSAVRALIEVLRVGIQPEVALNAIARLQRIEALERTARIELDLARADLLRERIDQTDAAREIYQAVLADDPDHTRALEALIDLSASDADLARHLSYVDRRVRTGDPRSTSLLVAATRRIVDRDPEGARQRLATALARGVRDAQTLQQALEVARALLDWTLVAQLGEQLLEQATLDRTQQVTLWREIAQIGDDRLQNRTLAIRALSQLVERLPGDDAARTRLGELQIAEGDLEAASEQLDFALAGIDRRQAPALWRRAAEARAVCAESTGDLARAIALYAAICEEDPAARTPNFRLAQLRARNGDHAAAAAHLDHTADLLSEHGDRIYALLRAAEHYQRGGDPAGAARAYLRSALLEPANEETWELALQHAADAGDAALQHEIDHRLEQRELEIGDRSERLTRLAERAAAAGDQDLTARFIGRALARAIDLPLLQRLRAAAESAADVSLERQVIERILDAPIAEEVRSGTLLRRAEISTDRQAAAADIKAAIDVGGHAPAHEDRYLKLLLADGRTGDAAAALLEFAEQASSPERIEQLLQAWWSLDLDRASGDGPAALGRWAAIAPHAFEPRWELANQASAAGRWEDCVALLKQLADEPLAAGRRLQVDRALGEAAWHAGDIEVACATLARAVAGSATDQPLRRLFAEALVAAERFVDAAPIFEQLGREATSAEQGESDLLRAAELWRDGVEDDARALELFIELQRRRPGDRAIRGATLELLRACDRMRELGDALLAAAASTAGLERREFLRLAATVYDEDVRDPRQALAALELLRAETAGEGQPQPPPGDHLRDWRARLLREVGDWHELARQLSQDAVAGDALEQRERIFELARLGALVPVDVDLVAHRLAEIAIARPADREALALLRTVASGTAVLIAALEQVAAQTEGQAAAKLLLEAADIADAGADEQRSLDLRLRAARRSLDDAALVDQVATRLVLARRGAEAADLLQASSVRRAGYARAWSRYCASAVAARRPGAAGELASAISETLAFFLDDKLLAANAVVSIANGDREHTLDLIDRLARREVGGALPAALLDQILLVAAHWSWSAPACGFPFAFADKIATPVAEASAECARAAAGRYEELAARLQHGPQGDRVARLARVFDLWAGPLDRPDRALEVVSALVDTVPAARRPRWLLERAALRYRLGQLSAARSDLFEALATSQRAGKESVAPLDEWRFARARDLAAAAGDGRTLTSLFDLRVRYEPPALRPKYIFLAAETALLIGDHGHAVSRLMPLLGASAPAAARAAEILWRLAWEHRDRDLARRLAPRLAIATYLSAPQRLRCSLDAFGLTGDPAFLRLAHGLARMTQNAGRARDTGRALAFRGQAPTGSATLDDVRSEAARLDAEGRFVPALARMAAVAAADPETGRRYALMLRAQGRFADRDRLLRLWAQRASGRSLAEANLWRARICLETTADTAACCALIAEAQAATDATLRLEPDLERALAAERGDVRSQAHFLARQLALATTAEARIGVLRKLVALCDGPLADPESALGYRLQLVGLVPGDLELALDAVRGHLELGQGAAAAASAARALDLIGRWPDAEGRVQAGPLLQLLRQRAASPAVAARLDHALVALQPFSAAAASVLEGCAPDAQPAYVRMYSSSEAERAAGSARLAHHLVERGEHRAAIACFELAHAHAPTTGSRRQLEHAYFRAGCFVRLADAYASEIALTDDPAVRSSLHFNLAELYRDRLQRYDAARAHLEQAARIAPREAVILRARVDLERQHGSPELLANALESMAQTCGAAEAAALRGEAGCALETVDPERAAGFLQRALVETPRDAALNAALGRIAEQRGCVADAIESFMAAAHTSAGAEAVRHWLRAARLAEAELRDLRLALHAYREAADLGDTLALAAAERIARALGDSETLERVLGRRAVATQNPRVRGDLLVERAGLLFALQRPREANLVLDGLYMEAPDDVETALAAGRLLESWRRPQQALAAYERVLAVPIRDAEPRAMHEIEQRAMQLYAVAGGFERATRLAERVLQRDPGSLTALTVLEAAARERGDSERLVELLRRRLELDLSSADRALVLLDLGRTYAEVLGDDQRAIDALSEAAGAESEPAEATRALFKVCERCGEPAAAGEVARRLLDVYGDDADATRWRLAIAEANRRAGDSDAAIAVLQQAIEQAPAEATAYFKLWEVIRDSARRAEFAPVAKRGRRRLKDARQRAQLGAIEAELALAAGDDDRAYEVLSAALKLSAEDPAAVANYRELCLRRGRMARFAEVLQQHVEAAETQQQRTERLRELAFVVRDHLFDEQRAAQLLCDVLADREEDGEALAALADLRYRAHDFGEAKRLLETMPADADPQTSA